VKTFTGTCIDSTLTLEEAEDMLEEAKALQIECERYALLTISTYREGIHKCCYRQLSKTSTNLLINLTRKNGKHGY
jgi:hypothetical protein